MRAYDVELRALAAMAPELARCRSYMISRFIDGLRPKLREMIAGHTAQTYRELVQMAHEIEEDMEQ